jgi:hypothetical protein
MKAYFLKIFIIKACLVKMIIHSYKLYLIKLITYKTVLNKKIRFYRVILTILDQKIYIICKIEHYIVQKFKKTSKI